TLPSPSGARGRGRQSTAFRKRLHVLDGPCEAGGSLRLVAFARGVIRQHGIVIEQRVVNFAGRRGEWTNFERPVIQVVGPPFAYRLRVGVGVLGLAHQDFTADRADGANFSVFARE